MKLSELIVYLQQAYDEFGDMSCWTWGEYGANSPQLISPDRNLSIGLQEIELADDYITDPERRILAIGGW